MKNKNLPELKCNMDADQVLRMRGILRAVTYMLQDVLEDGVPKPPGKRASMDERSADMEWHEGRWSVIRDAKELLRETEDCFGSIAKEEGQA